MPPMILVLGAGAFGLTAALALRARGLDVRVLDPGPLPRPTGSSTDTSRAVRMDYGDDEHHVELARQALEGWREWNERSGESLYHQDGMLFLTRAPWTEDCYEARSHRLLERRGARVERMDEAEITRRYPAFRAGAYVDGYLSHDAGWAHPSRTMRWLLGEARAAGVEILEGVAASSLLERSGRVHGVRTEAHGDQEGDLVLVATGPWTLPLLPELRGFLRPAAQPVIYVRPQGDPDRWRAPHLPVWAADISTTGWYAFPADDDGLVKIGHHGLGRELDPDAPREVLPHELQRLEEFFQRDVPGLAGAEVARARTCFYTDTPEGDFLIDRHPEKEGLVVATGGSGHGFKFAPVLGSLIARTALGEGREERYRWEGRSSRGTEVSRCPE